VVRVFELHRIARPIGSRIMSNEESRSL